MKLPIRVHDARGRFRKIVEAEVEVRTVHDKMYFDARIDKTPWQQGVTMEGALHAAYAAWMDRKVSPKPGVTRPDPWVCGFAAALAAVDKRFSVPGFVRGVIEGAGLKIEDLERAGVDKADLAVVRKALKGKG